MMFDSLIISAIAAELGRDLVSGTVTGIHQPSELDLVFTIRTRGANHSLLISAEAESPRVHLTAVKRPNPKTPPNFCMLLRKHLEGARLSGIKQVDFDRILHLEFDAYDGERVTLIIEIMGKHSNVILVSGTGRILGAIKPVGRRKNRYREVLPGRDYVPPPPQAKVNPSGLSRDGFAGLAASLEESDGMAAWLIKTFSGISPFLSQELAARAERRPDRLPDEMANLFEDVKAARFSPVLITDDAGRAAGFYPLRLKHIAPENQHDRPSVNAAADVFFASALPRESFEHARDEFHMLVGRELRVREKTRESIMEGLAEGERAERYKHIGELLLSQAAVVPEGTDSVELADYFSEGSPPIKVELDAQLTVPQNAEAYFKKYQKAQSAAEALADRLSEIDAQMRLLGKAAESSGAVTSEEQIRDLTEILRSHGIGLPRKEEPAAKKKPEFEGKKISRITSQGWEVLIGENSEANDYLVQRVARSNDIWMHVKSATGSHVLIRTNGKPDSVPRTVLHAAAELAVRHSSQKHSSLVPVDYTLAKNVRKPRGAAAGKVIYQQEKTIFITA